ncbi:MAG: hypothetical protein KGL39_03655 [Patescibacteria group bacterium]|nr:hypothetical protein [Patescibacteria group bacterium]
MTYRGTGLAKVDTSHPEAFRVCQRCGAWRNYSELVEQWIVAGAGLIKTGLFVCHEVSRCYDAPQWQNQSIILPPDPLPLPFAFPEPFGLDEGPQQPLPTAQQLVDDIPPGGS